MNDSRDKYRVHMDNSTGVSLSDASEEVTIFTCMEQYALYSTQRRYEQFTSCIKNANRQAPILNSEISNTPPTIIIALIVHNRDDYLYYTLKALQNAVGIENALLIVSHDGYYKRVHDMIESITFCRVKQLYHPYSKDLVNNTVTLFDPLDSKRNFETGLVFDNSKSTVEITLDNAEKIVQQSFIADEHFTQTAPKHHYWWLWNFIFRLNAGMQEIKINANDYVLFLEEDHFVTPDILTMLDAMKIARRENCPECIGLNMGFHNSKMEDVPSFITQKKINYSVLGNLGIAFQLADFKDILRSADEFCGFNDYNWDLTMYHMEQKGFISEISLAPSLSRVYHIGLCGMHIKADGCDPLTAIREIETKVVIPIQKFTESSFVEGKHSKISITPNWIEEKFSERKGDVGGVEGWTFGRLWGDDHMAKHMWTSSINKDHCIFLSKSSNL